MHLASPAPPPKRREKFKYKIRNILNEFLKVNDNKNDAHDDEFDMNYYLI